MRASPLDALAAAELRPKKQWSHSTGVVQTPRFTCWCGGTCAPASRCRMAVHRLPLFSGAWAGARWRAAGRRSGVVSAGFGPSGSSMWLRRTAPQSQCWPLNGAGLPAWRPLAVHRPFLAELPVQRRVIGILCCTRVSGSGWLKPSFCALFHCCVCVARCLRAPKLACI